MLMVWSQRSFPRLLSAAVSSAVCLQVLQRVQLTAFTHHIQCCVRIKRRGGAGGGCGGFPIKQRVSEARWPHPP